MLKQEMDSYINIIWACTHNKDHNKLSEDTWWHTVDNGGHGSSHFWEASKLKVCKTGQTCITFPIVSWPNEIDIDTFPDQILEQSDDVDNV